MATFLEQWNKVKKPMAAGHRLGIEAATQVCDRNLQALEDKRTPATLNAFCQAISALLARCGSYKKMLETEVQKQHGSALPARPLTDKEARDLKLQCKIASRGLRAIVLTMQSRLKGNTLVVQQLSAVDQARAAMMVNLRAAVQRGLLFVSQSKAHKEPIKFFNHGNIKAARDTAMQLNVARKSLERNKPDVEFNALKPWADQGQVLPATALAPTVAAEIKAFSQAVKGASVWWDAHTRRINAGN